MCRTLARTAHQCKDSDLTNLSLQATLRDEQPAAISTSHVDLGAFNPTDALTSYIIQIYKYIIVYYAYLDLCANSNIDMATDL